MRRCWTSSLDKLFSMAFGKSLFRSTRKEDDFTPDHGGFDAFIKEHREILAHFKSNSPTSETGRVLATAALTPPQALVEFARMPVSIFVA